jgi:hypothetical protein
MKVAIAIPLALLVSACTSIEVRPLDASAPIKQVCIVENPRVEVSDFVDVMRDGFDRHGMASSVVTAEAAKTCDVTLTYTALRKWDLAPYLAHAELRLWRDGRQIGSATYHLNGGGGLSLAKWEGTRTKMDPVMDQLLVGR